MTIEIMRATDEDISIIIKKALATATANGYMDELDQLTNAELVDDLIDLDGQLNHLFSLGLTDEDQVGRVLERVRYGS